MLKVLELKSLCGSYSCLQSMKGENSKGPGCHSDVAKAQGLLEMSRCHYLKK